MLTRLESIAGAAIWQGGTILSWFKVCDAFIICSSSGNKGITPGGPQLLIPKDGIVINFSTVNEQCYLCFRCFASINSLIDGIVSGSVEMVTLKLIICVNWIG